MPDEPACTAAWYTKIVESCMFRYQQLVTQEKYLAGHECLPRPGQDRQVNFWVDLQKVMGGSRGHIRPDLLKLSGVVVVVITPGTLE